MASLANARFCLSLFGTIFRFASPEMQGSAVVLQCSYLLLLLLHNVKLTVVALLALLLVQL